MPQGLVDPRSSGRANRTHRRSSGRKRIRRRSESPPENCSGGPLLFKGVGPLCRPRGRLGRDNTIVTGHRSNSSTERIARRAAEKQRNWLFSASLLLCVRHVLSDLHPARSSATPYKSLTPSGLQPQFRSDVVALAAAHGRTLSQMMRAGRLTMNFTKGGLPITQS